MLISQCHFVILMGPSQAHDPSAGPAEANGLPEAHGPTKFHGPRGHCTPCPPSRWPWEGKIIFAPLAQFL